MADRYLLESGAPDGYLLEDSSGVLILEGIASAPFDGSQFAAQAVQRSAQNGFAFVATNLLVSTLAAVAISRGAIVNEYKAKYQVRVDQPTNTLVLTAPPVAQIPVGRQLYDSAPQAKIAVQCEQQEYQRTALYKVYLGRGSQDNAPKLKAPVYAEQQPSRLALTATAVSAPFLPVDTNRIQQKYPVQAEQQPYQLTALYTAPISRGGTDNAPKLKAPVQAEQQINRLPLPTAAAGVPLLPVDTSQFMPKYQVQVDVYPNMAVIGIPGPNYGCWWADGTVTADSLHYTADSYCPRLNFLEFSSGPGDAKRKYEVYADQYVNFLPLRTPVGTAPFRPVDTDQIEPKVAVQADQYLNSLVLRQAQIFRPLNIPLVQQKYQVQVETYPNLNTAGLYVPPAAIPLPLGLPVDTSEWRAKFAVQVDIYPNTVLLGIPPAPVIVVPPPAPEASGGWRWGVAYERHLEQQRKRKKRELELLEAEEAAEALSAVERQIALLLYEQEQKDLERADTERILALARQWSDSEELSQRVRDAMLRALEVQTFGAIQVLMRELERMGEEEDIAALMLILNQ